MTGVLRFKSLRRDVSASGKDTDRKPYSSKREPAIGQVGASESVSL